MKMKTKYVCEHCLAEYDEEDDAWQCERAHELCMEIRKAEFSGNMTDNCKVLTENSKYPLYLQVDFWRNAEDANDDGIRDAKDIATKWYIITDEPPPF
jgi:hypothetical protein